MLVKTYGSAVHGIQATTVVIEVDVSIGIRFIMVGLPDSAVKESAERIDSALRFTGYKLPGKKILVNMAPADLKKEGSAYDLPIAIGILAASNQFESIVPIGQYVMIGELSLDGKLQPIRGALPIAIKAREEGFKGLILPKQNVREAAVVDQILVYGVENLDEVISILKGSSEIAPTQINTCEEFKIKSDHYDVDFSDVKGQASVKRALEIAAGGLHNILLIGPPGSGKTMLAKRIPTILPPLTLREALETTKIHSVAGKIDHDTSLMVVRPFRDPHHTISNIALCGGGNVPQPGEISLAHNGILFLDELPEFSRTVLEVLRQPLEDRQITISRARYSEIYPASFMLVASMNPCPCGFYNHPTRECVCPPGSVQKYLSRISGPLLDRIDIHLEVAPVPFSQLTGLENGESSAIVRTRVIAARQIQLDRFNDTAISCNSQMSSRQVHRFCKLDAAGQQLLKNAVDKLGLSARAFDRILKVARTIADLDNSSEILSNHLAEAIQYRSLDRSGWGA